MEAPGRPGISPRWTSSDKSGIGTALRSASQVWFTLSHGILNECYYPRVDQACIRDCGLIVTDGVSFFAEEKRDTESAVTTLADGVPAYELVNTHRTTDGSPPRFRIHKRVISDPRRAVVLQHIRLETLRGPALRLHVLLAPHLVNAGADNTAWTGDYKGQSMLFAEGSGTGLALGASVPWLARSAGFVGVSDGWQDLAQHLRLTWQFERAARGNVALTGELALPEDGTCVLALGFGHSASEAAFRVRSSLADDFAMLADEYAARWHDWQSRLRPLDRIAHGHNTYRVSTAVLRSHEAPSFRGGFIASLSIPWGASKGDDDLGGYHLVWPRDLVETAGGLLAAGASAEAIGVLDYLRAIQEPDGHWNQNNWLDGTPYWGGLQMDEVAFPILLLDLALREGAIPESALADYWPMARAAAGYVVRNGPVTMQDRWEENGGFSTFTLAVEIAGLVAAAAMAERMADPEAASFLRATADYWHSRLDDWVYAKDTPLARAAGVEGHYLRMSPDLSPGTGSDPGAELLVKNRADGQGYFPANAIISADALALVRFGLRDANDPRILGTVAVIDHCTRAEMPQGPCWYRYNKDGYGEHEDGRPFDGTGIGRLWPLLTGERAHYALAAGRRAEAEALLATLEASTSCGALIPEQIWDGDDIPERELFRGRPSGSAMPLVWAHSEHIKLLRSLADGTIFDLPPEAARRYTRTPPALEAVPWRPGFAPDTIPSDCALLVALPVAAILRWTRNGWKSWTDVPTRPLSLGINLATLPPAAKGTRFEFTWRNFDNVWVGRDFAVEVSAAAKVPA